MKFGKEFRTHLEETLPEWRDKFLCYKPLKKLLKHYPHSSSSTVAAAAAGDVDFIPPDQTHLRTVFADTTNTSPSAASDAEIPVGRPLEELQDSFVRILNNELEKFNDFYVDKEEEFVIRLQELKERIERVNEKSGKDGDSTAESEFSEEMMDIRKNLVTIHGEMVLLKNYGSLNFAGLVKILKKYDKRTGGLLRLPFTQLALSQPFFTMEPLTRLVCECEANLEILFPSEAEVVESNSDQSQSSLQQIISKPETSSSLGEENLDIYRSTLAAMKAIRGLQKASSTYNPLSFSSLLKNNDDETVTTENSPDSSGNLQGKDERGKDESESDPSH